MLLLAFSLFRLSSMFGHLLTTLITISICFFSGLVHSSSPWGKNYFPNTALTNHDGKTLHFFDDLIENKIVVINFIYTSCPDSCPLETAQLTRVQKILGDRLGKDIFFYSISIDPEIDTPEVLADYRGKFGAKWMFLTGDKQEIISLRRKLGLYIEDNPGGEKNHNVSMIIGNQKTGRWMKRSPFENPYVLADQVGNWLDGWKSPQKTNDYANAPSLRHISDGEKLFRTRCESCHAIGGSTIDQSNIGPDLIGVTERRTQEWLVRWLREPDKMLEEKDPIAYAMYKQFNEIPMPNMNLTQVDITDLLLYMKNESQRVATLSTTKKSLKKAKNKDILAVMDAWLKEAIPEMPNAGYMTLVNVGDKDIELIGIDSHSFESVELHEMALVDGMMEMRRLEQIIVPAKGQITFQPGAKHLMLKEAKQHLISGDRVDLTLRFASGNRQTLSVEVKAP